MDLRITCTEPTVLSSVTGCTQCGFHLTWPDFLTLLRTTNLVGNTNVSMLISWAFELPRWNNMDLFSTRKRCLKVMFSLCIYFHFIMFIDLNLLKIPLESSKSNILASYQAQEFDKAFLWCCKDTRWCQNHKIFTQHGGTLNMLTKWDTHVKAFIDFTTALCILVWWYGSALEKIWESLNVHMPTQLMPFPSASVGIGLVLGLWIW